MFSAEVFNKAFFFAADAHKEQIYPGTDLPYLIHLVKVYNEIVLLIPHVDGLDVDLMIQLALLHDTIEDTQVCFDDLVLNFGKTVAEGVLALSKNSSLAKSEQMLDSLKRIIENRPEVALVKMADRIANLDKPPVYWNKSKISEYQAEAKVIFEHLNGFCGYLDMRLWDKICKYEKFFVSEKMCDMAFSIVNFGYENQDLYKASLKIRQTVFVDEQKVSNDLEIDEYEEECVYFLLSESNKPLGTCRYRITEKGIKLERFAILKPYRSRGCGGVLLSAVLSHVNHIKKHIYFHAQLSAVDFYKKFGFNVVGDLFYEAGIPHYEMIQENFNI